MQLAIDFIIFNSSRNAEPEIIEQRIERLQIAQIDCFELLLSLRSTLECDSLQVIPDCGRTAVLVWVGVTLLRHVHDCLVLEVEQVHGVRGCHVDRRHVALLLLHFVGEDRILVVVRRVVGLQFGD